MVVKCKRCEAEKALSKAYKARYKACDKAYATWEKARDKAWNLKHADKCPKKAV